MVLQKLKTLGHVKVITLNQFITVLSKEEMLLYQHCDKTKITKL